MEGECLPTERSGAARPRGALAALTYAPTTGIGQEVGKLFLD